jgi:prepilin-type N-terminal cleavage/methylation domain-containing protein
MLKGYDAHCRAGFTLIELATVIIIIGFIIAGITSGISLVKTSELTSVVADFRSYSNSYDNFVTRYYQPPGDFTSANSVWPAGTGGCATAGNSCNGNGNGKIDTHLEAQVAWKELSLSGMINANINQIGATPAIAVAGPIMPESKALGRGYTMINGTEAVLFGTYTYNSGLWGIGATGVSNVNAVFIGSAMGTNTVLNASAYSPQDAFSIDKKIDDGSPSNGIVRAADGRDLATAGGCLSSSGAASYALTQTDVSCVVGMGINQ